jgi:hypothetical protein
MLSPGGDNADILHLKRGQIALRERMYFVSALSVCGFGSGELLLSFVAMCLGCVSFGVVVMFQPPWGEGQTGQPEIGRRKRRPFATRMRPGR